MHFIEDMRQRPEEERLAFAAIAAGIVGLILFLLWGFTVFRGNGAPIAQVEKQSQSATVIDSFQNTAQEVSKSFDEFSSGYNELTNALEEEQKQGKSVVDLTVDKNGDVQVGTIIIPNDELDFEN